MKSLQLTALFLLALIGSSCYSPRYVHTPMALNSPYFSKKGDSRLTAFYSGDVGTDDRNAFFVQGFDVLGAYAISNQFALTASYHQRKEGDDYTAPTNSPFDISEVRYHRSAWEAGAGYFVPIDQRRAVTFNLYAGIGSAQYNINDKGLKGNQPYTRYHHVAPFKFYVQPSLNVVAKPLQFAIIYRLNYLSYKNISTDYTDEELESIRLKDLNGKTIPFNELAFDLHFTFSKLPWLSIEAQMSCLAKSSYYRPRSFNGSIGLAFDVVKMLQKH